MSSRRGQHARGTVTITTAQLGRVLGTLADAARYRRFGAAQWCADCEMSPAGACGQHLGDLDAAQAYDELARQLQQQKGR